MSMRVRSRASLGKTGQERYVVVKRRKFRWTSSGHPFCGMFRSTGRDSVIMDKGSVEILSDAERELARASEQASERERACL